MRPRTVLLALTFATALAAQNRPWNGYPVILWSTGDPHDLAAWPARVREAGYDAIPVGVGRRPSPGLSHYFENIVPELAFLHARQPLYNADVKSYAATRNPEFLVRKPCFDDPEFWQTLEPRLAAEIRAHAPDHPLLYDLRDEPSIGAYTAPMDYCFCRHTLRAFRQWLKTRYSSLAALNTEWETDFRTWDDVVPFTTFEIKQREQAALAAGRRENFAPWADHREYMDISFAAALDRMRSIVRKIDPDTPVGIEGAQAPTAWGGYDLWRLSKVVDWVEPYDLLNSRAMWRSFLPPAAPVLNTYFGKDTRVIRRTAWLRLLDGDRGAVIWDDADLRVIRKSEPGMPLAARGTDLRDIFSEIKGAAPQLAGLKRAGDGIAIHYSQAGIRAHWMFDSREDGDRWLNRLAPYEREHSRLAKVRDAFVKIVEDLGFNPDFVSYEQIKDDELIRKGYKVLLLPQSVAMSELECRRIEAFARAGGVVIADTMVATMDEHDRRLPAGRLDALFGVRQTTAWKPVGDGAIAPSRIPGAAPLLGFDAALPIAATARRGSIPDAPMVVRNGSAFFLNLDLRAYPDLRLSWPRGANFIALFRALFAAAGIESRVRVTGAHDILVRSYNAPGVEYVALARNPKSKDEPEPLPDTTVRLHVTLPRQSRVSSGGRDLGAVRELDVDLDPWRPTILELRQSR